MSKNNETQQVAAQTAGFPALTTLPDLSKADVAPTELLGEQATGETRELNIVKFVEKQGDEFRTIRNGSARLYGAFEQFARDLKPGQPFLITYLGKKKTNTGKFADSWSVKPLIVK